MAQEVEAELGVSADPAQAKLGCDLRFSYGVRAQIGQFDGLHVAPDQFHRVEVVGVRGSSSATSQDRWPASQAVMALDL